MIKITNIEAYLREHGISPSYQRKRIFEYLNEKQNHPNVNQIYEELVKDIPTLSKTTVYNTLNMFVEKKLVEAITIEGTEIRYDLFNAESHGHFKCESCGTVYDVDMDINLSKIKNLDGFQVKEQSFHFKGICKNCLCDKNK